MEKIKYAYFSTYFLIDYAGIKDDKVVGYFIALLGAVAVNPDFESNIKAYADFVTSLKKKDFSYYLKNALNKCIKIENQEEYDIISGLTKISYEEIKNALIKKFYSQYNLLSQLPKFENTVMEKIECIEPTKNERAFIFDSNCELKPVAFSEKTKFFDLKGYVEQKKVLYKNTKALLNGSKVNNILLYGDAGCGKSTSVRALMNEFEDLKIVQIFKDNLINLDKLFDKLSTMDSKFIIFADDISFDENDKELPKMKAILEGSIIQCPKNAVIYATSNRRHLIRESFQSRKGDEIHLNDTLNEISSLSERFGINLLFLKPNNSEFLNIVFEIAKDNKISLSKEELEKRAKAISIKKGTTSPRIARQLIDNLVAGIDI